MFHISKNLPAAKFASQRDAHVRTNTQIKFLYYPLIVNFLKKHPDFGGMETNQRYEIQTLGKKLRKSAEKG